MKSTMLWTLVALNVLLAVMLISRHTQDNAAFAQAPAVPRRPGDYLIIPGEVTGSSSGIIYILDTTNGWLGAMSYDDSNKKLDVMTRIDLAKTLQQAAPNTGKTPAGGSYNR
jgi:hypothetical protein